ncbi:MAG: site-2 protease family protein, partial [Phycisphaerae bacterium]
MDFLGGSIRIGRVLGIDIRVHMLFLIWMVFRLIDAGQDWRNELLFLLMLFSIVLVHEYGHCLGARSVGGDARDIMLWPLGGLAFAHAPMTPWAQFVTVASGPLVNVIFCVLSALTLIVSTGDPFVCSPNPFDPLRYASMKELWHLYVGIFYFVNLMLLCFNLLPIYPLDGGQLFMTILWPFMGLHRATDVACKVGIGGAVFLAGLGLMRSQWMLLAIAVFGGMTCWQRLQALRYGMVYDERVSTPRRPGRGPGWWTRLRGAGRPPREAPPEPPNPNPGAWERKLERNAELEQELDRILKKVHDHGVRSLSYT